MSKDIHITDFEQPQHSPGMTDLLDSLKDVEIPLDSESLVQLAKEKIDVPFHYDEAMLQRFQYLFKELQSSGSTHKVGLMALQQKAVNCLSDVSRMEYLHGNYQEVGATPVAKPVVIAGMPRSGTTHLLQLLSSNPLFHTSKGWHIQQALPSKAMLAGEAENNLADCGEELRQSVDMVMPHFKAMYTAEPNEATEELALFEKGGYGVAWSLQGDIPNADRAFYETDQTECYQFLYRFLQALQWVDRNNGAKHWLLKTPQHLGALTALKNVFPDATIVCTHRDPASVFTSMVYMIGYGLRGFHNRCSKQAIIDIALRMQHGLLRGLVNNIDNMGSNVEHVYFDQFMKDKHDAVTRIYQLAGIDFDEAAKQRITDMEASHSRAREGRVIYDLEADFGLKRDEIREQFAYYTDRFPVAIEEVHQ